MIQDARQMVFRSVVVHCIPRARQYQVIGQVSPWGMDHHAGTPRIPRGISDLVIIRGTSAGGPVHGMQVIVCQQKIRGPPFAPDETGVHGHVCSQGAHLSQIGHFPDKHGRYGNDLIRYQTIIGIGCKGDMINDPGQMACPGDAEIPLPCLLRPQVGIADEQVIEIIQRGSSENVLIGKAETECLRKGLP